MKFGGFIHEELSAYKAHVTLSAKHLSQEHTGFASINKLHSDLLLFYHKDRYVIIGAIHCCLNMYKQVGRHKNSRIS